MTSSSVLFVCVRVKQTKYSVFIIYCNNNSNTLCTYNTVHVQYSTFFIMIILNSKYVKIGLYRIFSNNITRFIFYFAFK